MLTRQCCEAFAYQGRSREGDFPDDLMRDQVVRNIRGDAEDQVHDSGRNAGIRERPDQFGARSGGLLRAFQDDGTTGGKRGRDLAYGLIDGEIPRRETGNWTDG